MSSSSWEIGGECHHHEGTRTERGERHHDGREEIGECHHHKGTERGEVTIMGERREVNVTIRKLRNMCPIPHSVSLILGNTSEPALGELETGRGGGGGDSFEHVEGGGTAFRRFSLF